MNKENRILVTYASRAGSTAGISEAIAISLAENGVQTVLYPMQEVQDLSPYSAVVAGSAIHGGKWLPEAMQFMQAHRQELAHKPFAAFLVCMTLAIKNEKWRNEASVRGWLAPVRALVKPASEGFFTGALDISKIPSFSDRLKFRVSILTGVWSEDDHRDWDAIRAWARELPAQLDMRIQQSPNH